MSHLMPAVFIGHGNPMYAIESNRYAQAWQGLSSRIAKPKAILVISAHWLTSQTWVTAMTQPPTIHDFSGFPEALFKVSYPAPGSPQLANQVADLLSPTEVILEEFEWGLDHGTWAPLLHMYPNADIPVVQLSLDARLTGAQHYALAQQLRPLREAGVLIVGSGNVVHNLRVIDFTQEKIYPWAERFNTYFRQNLLAHQHQALIDFQDFGQDHVLAVPTLEHYWPALYVLAQQADIEPVSIIVDGIDAASISMLSFVVGQV